MIVARTSYAALLLLTLLLVGCEPTGIGTLDEEKEQLFVEATGRRLAGDVPGAIQLFERAIHANPANASAHLELGLLCEKPMGDFASAIYHFQKFLMLRPNSDRAEVVKDHILTCKQELVRTVLPASLPQTAERELIALSKKNEDLRRELETVKLQYSNALVVLSNQTLQLRQAQMGSARNPMLTDTSVGRQIAPAGSQTPPTRQHVIAGGDTFSSIARRYGVSIESLRQANPGLNERRLPVGKPLQMPAK